MTDWSRLAELLADAYFGLPANVRHAGQIRIQRGEVEAGITARVDGEHVVFVWAGDVVVLRLRRADLMG